MWTEKDDDTIQQRGGNLYLLSVMAQHDEPRLIVRWYPIGRDGFRAAARGRDDLIGAPAVRRMSGAYEARIPNRWGPLQFTLLDNGATTPDFQEEIDIPKPKARVQVRWCMGRWEKLLASRGWVPVDG